MTFFFFLIRIVAATKNKIKLPDVLRHTKSLHSYHENMLVYTYILAFRKKNVIKIGNPIKTTFYFFYLTKKTVHYHGVHVFSFVILFLIFFRRLNRQNVRPKMPKYFQNSQYITMCKS